MMVVQTPEDAAQIAECVRLGGAESFVGLQSTFGSSVGDLVLFTSHGTTLAVPLKNLSPSAVAAKILFSQAEFKK